MGWMNNEMQAKDSGMKKGNRVLTHGFVEKWKSAYREFYGYAQKGPFLLVPSLRGGITYSYLPGLTYSDMTREEVAEWRKQVQNERYTIRVLDPEKERFEPNEPVTMRVSIEGLDQEGIVAQFHSTKRRNLRRSDESDITVKIGMDAELMEDFYDLYTLTMYRLGTPPLAKGLFETTARYVESEIAIAYVGTNPAAGLFIVYDEEIAWNPYAASDRTYADTFANETLYRDAMFRALEKGKAIFDCGRSPYGGGTYQFKKKMGAKPVGLAILKEKEENIYAKYSRAAKMWQRLPKPVADFLGPKLRKYLADS